MSEAREKYYNRANFIMMANDKETASKDSVYIDYIIELEQQNAELVEALKDVTEFLPQLSSFPKKTDTRQGMITKKIYELIRKHTEAHHG